MWECNKWSWIWWRLDFRSDDSIEIFFSNSKAILAILGRRILIVDAPLIKNTAEFVFFTHCIVGFEPSDFRDTLTPITASLDRVGRWNKDHDTNSRIFPLLCGLSYIVGLCFRISWLDWLKVCVILPSAWRKISSFLQSVKEIKPLVFLLLYLSQRKSNWNCREELLTELPRYVESS